MSITDRKTLLQEQLDALKLGSVILTRTEDGEPINAAIKDFDGTWAMGGFKDPWPAEKLARGIDIIDAELIVLVAE
jgi:hypothetical protein